MSATASADEGIVCTPDPLATEAGLAVLRKGGTAAEAAVAAGAVLTVTCPYFCGLGGDGVWIVSDREGLRRSILGIGQAAAAVPCDRGPIPNRGAGSMLTTAGLVPSWQALLRLSGDRWTGGLPLGGLLSEARDIAEQGFPISGSHAFWLDFRSSERDRWPGFAEVFMPGGQPPEVGTLFRQGALARILGLLIEEGLESFRTGSVARELALGLREAGSPIALSDLVKTEARSEAALSLRSGDWTVFAPPPPTQGATTLLIQALLVRLCGPNRRPADPTMRMHLQVEAVKQAFLHRSKLGDPDFSNQSRAIPSGPAIDKMAGCISPAVANNWPATLQTADTAYLAVIDNEGRCVSGLQSTYFDWGSGIPVGNTGILWHNRGAAFSGESSDANGLKAGKRPFHTLTPGLAVRGNGETILFGTQGADGQPQTLTVILDRLLSDGAEIEEALAEPRFLLGRTFSDSRDTLKIEVNAGVALQTRLTAMKHELTLLSPLSPLAGQAGAVRMGAGGEKTASHDPRGKGTAGSTPTDRKSER
ncbi:gamma-glutamyltransferase [Pseudoroseicyclus sp. H15]